MYKKVFIFSDIFWIILFINIFACIKAESEAKVESEEGLLVTEINWRKIDDVGKLAEYANIRNDLGFHLAAVRQARRLLACKKSPPYDNFIKSGIIPTLVKFLSSKNTTLQFDSTWILAHIASGGTEEQTAVIVEADAIPHFIRLLNSPNKEIVGQALLGLAHIINKNAENRDKCINAGIIPALIKLADSESSNIAINQNIAWTLKNICKHQNSNNLLPITVIQEIMPIFSNFLKSENALILSETLMGIANCGNGSRISREIIINHQKIVKKVIPAFLKSTNSKIQHSVLNVFKVIANGTIQQRKILLNDEILNPMKALIKSTNKHIKRDVLYIFEKIIETKNEQEINYIFDAAFIHEIVKLLKFNDYKNRINAAKIISNISENPKIARILIKQNVIPRLCKILKHPFENDGDIICVLKTAKNILENSGDKKSTIIEEINDAGGISLFLQFKIHRNDEVKKLTKEIIDFINSF
uniref:Importin subunit alpha n=1 Tax=Panagrolaimus sp. ES5 TaxID=591445 RepID=A0AC34F600_9BILA